LKYVTQVRLVKRLTEDTYDDLFDYLQQFEKLVNASRAKKLEKSHDPLIEKGHYARNCPKPRVQDLKYFTKLMLLAKHDESRVTLTDEQNDFLVADATRMEEIEELNERYENPYTLKKAISQNPKLYDASCFSDTKIYVNVRDIEDILDDATKNQTKMENKLKDPVAIEKKQNVHTIDYNKLNALYQNFVPQKELSAEQK
nr:hypothetical protein [Tanacetum cinerariifolium]